MNVDVLQLVDSLVSGRTGRFLSFSSVRALPGEPRFSHWRVDLQAGSGNERSAWLLPYGVGISLDSGEAKRRALGEAIERYCSLQNPVDQVTTATFDQVSDSAVDISTLPRLSADEVGSGHCRFTVLDERSEIDWCEGYSYPDGNKALLPAEITHLGFRSRGARYFPPVSTGTASASDIHGAAVSAVLELIERDAIATSWILRRPVTALDLESSNDRNVQDRLFELERSGLWPLAVDLSTDNGIPVVFVMLFPMSPGYPVCTSGASAHFDPNVALCKAIDESVGTRSIGVGLRPYVQRMQCDTDRYTNIRHFLDHLILFGFPEMLDHLAIWSQTDVQPIPAACAESVLSSAKKLEYLWKMLRQHEMDLYFADLTTQDMEQLGIYTLRALVPQLMPLTEDHNVRFLDTPRLAQLARLWNCPLDPAVAPHPFA